MLDEYCEDDISTYYIGFLYGIEFIDTDDYKNDIEKLSFEDEEPKNIKAVAEAEKPDFIFSNDENENADALILTPKTLVIGMGCKRGKSFEELLEFILKDYNEEELRNNLYAICSIDKKADEPGLLRLCAYLHT